MTAMAGARSLTASLDVAPPGATWPISAAEVSTKLLVNGAEELSGSPAEPFSATESVLAASARKSVAHRLLLFPEQRTLEKFLVLQDWEGVVDSIGPEIFTARLRDRTNEETYASEMVELPVADVSDDDRELLRPGAIFYLTVARVIRASGRQDRVGRLVFRRLPAWTASTLRRAEQRAERLRRFLAPQN